MTSRPKDNGNSVIGYKKGKDGAMITLEIIDERVNQPKWFRDWRKKEGIADPDYAKFYCSKALVLDILHPTLGNIEETYSPFDSTWGRGNFDYKVGEIVSRADIVKEPKEGEMSQPMNGIHYYKTVQAAGEEEFIRPKPNWTDASDGPDIVKIGHKKKDIAFGFDGSPLNGIVKLHHYNGALDCRVTFVNGVMHGPYETRYSNGNKRDECEMVDGEIHGLYEAWHREGELFCLINYRNGVLHGSREMFYKDGNIKMKSEYVGGVRVGKHIECLSPVHRGSTEECNFDNDGKLHGEWIKWGRRGEFLECFSYDHGKRHGKCYIAARELGTSRTKIVNEYYIQGDQVSALRYLAFRIKLKLKERRQRTTQTK